MLRILMLRVITASLFFLFLPLPRSETASNVVLNAASLGHEPAQTTQLAAGSIATFRGSMLALRSERASFEGGDPPFTVAGTTVAVNAQPARIFYVSPGEVIFVVPDNTALGAVEVVVTNSEGFSSKADVTIASSAPGVFTVSADGQGEGIILDADTLLAGPFDPSNGQRRLSIFVTGIKNASTLTVSIRDQNPIVEAVERSSLLGLDEIHVLLPSQLRGAGASTLIVEADGVRSNPVSVVIGGAPPVSQDKVVISQIFGGGGNSGAPYRNDFIEIFNAGDTPVNVAGWSVQYASATASTWSTTPLNPIALAPGQYYLIQQAGGSNGAQLPAPDATGTIAMAAGAGKVALVKNTTALTGACPNNPNIVDLAGYGGTASCFQGSGSAPGGSNTNAVMRKTNGCTDTRSNTSDFALATPNARNTVAPINPCTITNSVLPWFADALAERRTHDFAPTFRLRRFP